MILVRDIFQLKFGKAKDAIALWQEGKTIAQEIGHGVADRLTTNLTGPYYRMVMESTHESLAVFEESMGSIFKYDMWREWYSKFSPLIESGSREIYTIVD